MAKIKPYNCAYCGNRPHQMLAVDFEKWKWFNVWYACSNLTLCMDVMSNGFKGSLSDSKKKRMEVIDRAIGEWNILMQRIEIKKMRIDFAFEKLMQPMIGYKSR